MLSSTIFAVVAQALTAMAATQNVVVGANGLLQFAPSTIYAQPGDTVSFNFASQNHSVVSGAAGGANPCQPGPNALFSKFQPATVGAAKNPIFNVQINNTQPIYIYCSQASHCQNGMVMIINAKNGGDQTTFAKAAAGAQTNTSPTKNVINGGTVINNASCKKPTSSSAAAGAAKSTAAAAKSSAVAKAIATPKAGTPGAKCSASAAANGKQGN